VPAWRGPRWRGSPRALALRRVRCHCEVAARAAPDWAIGTALRAAMHGPEPRPTRGLRLSSSNLAVIVEAPARRRTRAPAEAARRRARPKSSPGVIRHVRRDWRKFNCSLASARHKPDPTRAAACIQTLRSPSRPLNRQQVAVRGEPSHSEILLGVRVATARRVAGSPALLPADSGCQNVGGLCSDGAASAHFMRRG
jgi:hypothetical protein